MTQGVALAFGGRLDSDAWAHAHRQGAVPDLVPYGLHRLSDHGFRLRGRSMSWSAGPPDALPRRVLRRFGGGFDWGLVASKRPDADLLLSWDERPGAVLALRHGAHLPVVTNVIWLTDQPQLSSPWVRLALRGLRRARALFVLSSAQIPVLESLGIPGPKIAAVPFGIDVDFFRPTSDLGDPDLIVSVGNDRHRDWDATLETFRRVRRQRPSARLVVVSHTAPPAALARVEGVAHIPHLDHTDLRDLIARAGLLLVMTRHNLHVSGITAILESLAMGRPVVTTRTPGLQDYAAADDAVIAVDGSGAASRAVLELLGDDDARRARGSAGRAAAVEHFSTGRQAERIAEVLRRAVDGFPHRLVTQR